MRKSIKYSVTAVLLLSVLIAAFFFYAISGHVIVSEYFKRESNSNLNFSFGRFSVDNGARNSITNTKWTNGKLIVEGIASPNCGTTWIFGNYKINNNNLTLIYSPVLASVLASTCNHKVKYTITGLQKNEFQITLVQRNEIFEEPELLYKIFGVYD